MSDALAYLVKARPDALSHYLAFLKNCGRHLDPKTRDLISLVTKVHAQTERGFRQYLRRALRDGCTPHEVLDALLMAFPALGLTKIVWAVDLILAMDLPGFDLAALQAAQAGTGSSTTGGSGQWHDVMPVDAMVAGEPQRVECDGRGLFIYRATPQELAAGAARDGDEPDEWRVFDSLCPHETTNIPHLALQGSTLTCPKHEWVFDVRTGVCIGKGDAPLRRWPAKVQRARLLVRW